MFQKSRIELNNQEIFDQATKSCDLCGAQMKKRRENDGGRLGLNDSFIFLDHRIYFLCRFEKWISVTFVSPIINKESFFIYLS
ncbi:hypothetical protein BpHYR1_052273 [Brachionus plicatilis]|uniref:Uncharacterized protein n=1 Tax=Brachionus plicatilis TaxID=10195 RepID=A0A3M7SQS7_BRAPC|nr:hypothetical protein BpHYR1_052273 [Brachionus plicatilis]